MAAHGSLSVERTPDSTGDCRFDGALMKILIVDDSKAMRAIVMRALRQAGFGDHTFLQAENGQLGLEVVESESPDVILSDWNMPVMGGLEFCSKVAEKNSKVKFGFITSEASSDLKKEAVDAGASFFVVKPFTPDAIQSALSGVIA